MSNQETTIDGLPEVRAKFRRLGDPRQQKNAATRSARKAMNIVKKRARENAKAIDDPGSSEQIWKNIIVKPARIKNKNYLVMRVGVKGGAKQYAKTKANLRANRVGQTYSTAGSKSNAGGDTWYWRFAELGTSRQRASPFLRVAFYNSQDNITNEFISSYSTELDKELAKS